MHQVLVQNSGTLEGTFDDPSAVPAGRIAAFNAKTGEGINLADVDATGGDQGVFPDEVIFVLGGEVPFPTNILSKSKVAKVTKRAYAAPSKQVQTVTFTGPSAGDVTLKVVETSQGHEPYPRASVTVRIAEGATATEVATAVVAAINARPGSNPFPVTATSAAGVVTLTAREFGEKFRVAVDGTVDAAVAETTAPNLGSGTFAQVRDLELGQRGIVGDYYERDPILGKLPDFAPNAVAGKTYDIYCLLHETPYDISINKSYRFQEIYFALDSSVSGDLDAFFGDLLDS